MPSRTNHDRGPGARSSLASLCTTDVAFSKPCGMSLGTLRHLLLRRAGRLTRPQGTLRLSTAATGVARRKFEALYDALAA